MKILLVAVNAKYIHSNLAVYSLRAYASKYAKHIGLVEYSINHSEEDILQGIYEEQADVIAFSCYIWNIEMITSIVTELKKVQPKAKIWFGGPEVSYDAKKCLEAQRDLDGIMIGEGEQTFLELLEYYVEETKDLDAISGLAFKDKVNGQITVTSVRQPLSLDAVPFPYEEMDTFHNKIIYYESSRGCPFACSYCLSSIDKRVRLRSTQLVKKELKFLMDHQVPQIKFVDRTFNCNRKHTMDIWRFIKEQDNGITNFHFEISADLLQDEEIEFLSTLRPGQVQLEIGVQTTNPHTVEAIHRTMDLEKLSLNVARIKEGNNIHQHLDLIAGLPLEGIISFEKSFDDVYNLKPDQLQLGFLKILKGSLMETECKTYGISYRSKPPYEVLFTDQLSYVELLQIKGVCEMVEIYYNSGQFTYAINYLEHFFTSPMELYLALSDYYNNTGLALMAHSRIKKYEILLDFYKEMVLDILAAENRLLKVALFQEILVMDLFLREDMKSRPSFAPIRPQQNNLREIYEKHQIDRKLIHIEQFTFDVIASAKSGHVVEKNTTILFDYSKKDPLNKAAKLILLD
ncbi:MAG: B12-binding domain-containing radical SAM protein [Mobilitalea sp.]